MLTRDYTVIPATHSPTRAFTDGMTHACLYSPATEHHRTLTGTHIPSTAARRLGWPGWLVTYQSGLPIQRRSPIPVLTGFDVE